MALQRSLKQLALALKHRSNNNGSILDIVTANSGCSAPSPLHNLSAVFTSLRLLGTDHRLASPVQHHMQQRRSRQLTTAPPPEQQQPSGSAASSGAGGLQLGETLEEIRARIFGSHIGNGLRSGRKVLRGKLLGPKIASYYPEDMRKNDPLMISLKAERAKMKLDRMRRRGKAPPKKGAGKRSKK